MQTDEGIPQACGRIALTCGLTCKQAADDLGVGMPTLNRWITASRDTDRRSGTASLAIRLHIKVTKEQSSLCAVKAPSLFEERSLRYQVATPSLPCKRCRRSRCCSARCQLRCFAFVYEVQEPAAPALFTPIADQASLQFDQLAYSCSPYRFRQPVSFVLCHNMHREGPQAFLGLQ